MRIINTPSGIAVTIYADGKEMVSKRYSRFQKYLLMDAGVGSDLPSISRHFTRLYGFVGEVMTEDALKECENLHLNFFTVLSEINFGGLAFACLVYKIGDELRDDISEEGLKTTQDLISDLGLTVGEMDQLTEEIKKKISDDLKLYFPRLFPDDSLSFYQVLKEQTMLFGEILLAGDAVTDSQRARMKELERYFLEQNRPQSFRPDEHNNAVVEMDKTFAALCASIDSNGGTQSSEMTVFDFYARLDYLYKPTTQK